jgi:ribonuclease HI
MNKRLETAVESVHYLYYLEQTVKTTMLLLGCTIALLGLGNCFGYDVEHCPSAEIWYTDGSLLEGSAGGVVVRVIRSEVRECILVPLGEGQVVEGEIQGLLRATEWALSRDADQILIVLDSQAGLLGILSTAPHTGQSQAIVFNNIVCTAMSCLPSLHIMTLWTPAHIGTTGNKLADDTAKVLAHLPPSPSLTLSLSSCKH